MPRDIPTPLSRAARDADGGLAWQTDVSQYGGFWIRLAAGLIDVVVLFFIVGVFGLLLGVLGRATGQVDEFFVYAATIFAFVLLPAPFLAFPPTLGATPGKLLFGYHIVNSKYGHIDYGQAIARFLGQQISLLALFLGFIWIAFDPRKQGWHDKIAETFVVRKEYVRR